MIVAPVTGTIGTRIQTWRKKYDPLQVLRLPPHATVLYWANLQDGEDAALDAQIRDAFHEPVDVRLTAVKQFPNPDETRYIEVMGTETLDAARARLFDGTHLVLPEQRKTWGWHVTAIRYGNKTDLSVIEPAISELDLNDIWTVDTLLLLELQNVTYHEVKRWNQS